MADGKEIETPLTALEKSKRHFASLLMTVKENHPKLLAVSGVRERERVGRTRSMIDQIV